MPKIKDYITDTKATITTNIKMSLMGCGLHQCDLPDILHIGATASKNRLSGKSDWTVTDLILISKKTHRPLEWFVTKN